MQSRPGRLARSEPRIVALLLVVTALRVGAYGLALPFPNNVDEHAHADLVVKLSRGYWPGKPHEFLDEETVRILARYGSPEYLAPPGAAPPVPSWRQPPDVMLEIERRRRGLWRAVPNHEAHTTPLYYLLPALSFRLARTLGFPGVESLYAARLANVPVVVLFVYCAWVFCRRQYPARPEIRLGVPILLAFLPQDLFFSFNTDLLSPLAATGFLLALCSWYASEGARRRTAAVAGLLLGLAFLVRYTNAALMAPAAFLALLKCQRDVRAGCGGRGVRELGILAAAAAVPVAVVFGRNALVLGDPTAQSAKVALAGWTPSSWEQIVRHPIFRPDGLLVFWNELVPGLWRGEIVWYSERLSYAGWDDFFAWSTAILLAAAAMAWVRAQWHLRRSPGGLGEAAEASRARPEHAALGLSLLAALVCQGALSVAWDFHDFPFPSREYPYFTQGRLISAQLLPLMVLYVDGISCLLPTRRRHAATLVLVVLLAFALSIGELMLMLPIFQSPLNAFHLP